MIKDEETRSCCLQMPEKCKYVVVNTATERLV